ncbi:Holliday junction branch migration protein RuvA, partial [Salmonella enterica subsp. enterica serovar Kentucky]
KQESTLFKEKIKTNGVGPKHALAILTGMSAQQVVKAVDREELGALSKMTGNGKKTPEWQSDENKDGYKELHGDLYTPELDCVL